MKLVYKCTKYAVCLSEGFFYLHLSSVLADMLVIQSGLINYTECIPQSGTDEKNHNSDTIIIPGWEQQTRYDL